MSQFGCPNLLISRGTPQAPGMITIKRESNHARDSYEMVSNILKSGWSSGFADGRQSIGVLAAGERAVRMACGTVLVRAQYRRCAKGLQWLRVENRS